MGVGVRGCIWRGDTCASQGCDPSGHPEDPECVHLAPVQGTQGAGGDRLQAWADLRHEPLVPMPRTERKTGKAGEQV